MNIDESKDHWTDLAAMHGEHLNAMPRMPPIKVLEIDVLALPEKRIAWRGIR
jgi:hypothetical protein